MRLTNLGLLHRVTTGFCVAVPDDQVGTDWKRFLEAAAAGIAVAVPTRHDPVRLADRQAARLVFVVACWFKSPLS